MSDRSRRSRSRRRRSRSRSAPRRSRSPPKFRSKWDQDSGDRSSTRGSDRREPDDMVPYNPTEVVATKILEIPANLKSGLIGKGGHLINYIRRECQSHIQIQNPAMGSKFATITIRGNVARAEKMIQEQLQGLQADGESEEWVSEFVECPQQLVALVVGPKGKTVHEIAEKSGCLISFIPMSEVDPAAPKGRQICRVKGPQQKLQFGCQAVREQIAIAQKYDTKQTAKKFAQEGCSQPPMSSPFPQQSSPFPQQWQASGGMNSGMGGAMPGGKGGRGMGCGNAWDSQGWNSQGANETSPTEYKVDLMKLHQWKANGNTGTGIPIVDPSKAAGGLSMGGEMQMGGGMGGSQLMDGGVPMGGGKGNPGMPSAMAGGMGNPGVSSAMGSNQSQWNGPSVGMPSGMGGEQSQWNGQSSSMPSGMGSNQSQWNGQSSGMSSGMGSDHSQWNGQSTGMANGMGGNQSQWNGQSTGMANGMGGNQSQWNGQSSGMPSGMGGPSQSQNGWPQSVSNSAQNWQGGDADDPSGWCEF